MCSEVTYTCLKQLLTFCINFSISLYHTLYVHTFSFNSRCLTKVLHKYLRISDVLTHSHTQISKTTTDFLSSSTSGPQCKWSTLWWN